MRSELADEDPTTTADPILDAVARAPAIAIFEPIGQVLGGRYRVIALLGQGGMGRVYEAEDRELGRRVAVKVLRVAAPLADRARLLHERMVAASLEHPSIVPVYDAGLAPNGEPFFVMRLARGERFDRLIARAEGLEARLGLVAHMVAVAGAIAFAHRRGVVHGDLKPANILIGDSGETLVADWGLARRVTERGIISSAGTRAYMAPERAAGAPLDERSDVYGLGAMLFHVLSGGPPPRGPRPALVGAPADAVEIVARALAEPAARYATVADLAADLERFERRRRCRRPRRV